VGLLFQEKFNIWIAWLNLENAFGSPPEEAAMKLFQRALPHNDQKKLYMALHGETWSSWHPSTASTTPPLLVDEALCSSLLATHCVLGHHTAYHYTLSRLASWNCCTFEGKGKG
jgi:hypothetical protein